jgi:hypothetical protein
MTPTKFYDSNEGLFGFKDDKGVIIIPPVFDKAESFKNGFAVVKNDILWGVIDAKGKTIIPFNYDFIIISHNGWIHAQIEAAWCLFTTDGVLHLTLNNILSWRYPEAGIIAVKKTNGWGCIDMRGKTVVPFIYKSLGPVTNNWLSFFENGKWGWLNKDGKVVIEPQFDQLGKWNQEYWWGRIGDTYTLYNFYGQVICDEGWEQIVTPNKNMAAVKTQIGWKYINPDFSTRLQLLAGYQWADHFSEGLAPVKKNDLWGFIDVTGKELIAPRYSMVNSFSEGLAAVCENGLWGFIDFEGNTAIPFDYTEAGYFNSGKARVKKNLNYFFIDLNNKTLYFEEDDYE